MSLDLNLGILDSTLCSIAAWPSFPSIKSERESDLEGSFIRMNEVKIIRIYTLKRKKNQ